MHYHIVTKDDGSGGYPLNYLYFIHCDMNYNFERCGINIRFYIDTISYIKSSKYYNLVGAPSNGTEDKEMTGLYNTLNHCNAYLVDDPSGTCGYAPFPTQGLPSERSSIIFQASFNNFDCSNPGNKTLPHEMGHWLDLRHTFFGWEGKGTYPPDLTKHPRSEWENVDRTGTNANCLTKGDGFCDTDPDYLNGRWTCPYSGAPLTDGVGKSFTPTGRNFMSYSNDECSDTFSPQQKARMEGALTLYNDRKDLMLLPVPNYPDIGTFSYFYPKQSTNVNHRFPRKNLKFRFNALAGTTKYLVTLGKSSGTTINNSYDFLPTDLLMDTLVTDTVISVPLSKLGANPNNTYFYWKVRAFNKMSACGDNVIVKQAFRVKDLNIEFKGVSPKCNGQKDGMLVIYDSTNVTTNEKKYNSTVLTTDTIKNIGAGNHTLEVKMLDGTYVYFDESLKEPAKITATVTYPANFSATLAAQGGTPPYTYTWSNGKTGAAQTGLAAGTYNITVTDKNGCKLEEYQVKINSNGSGGSGGTGGSSIAANQLEGLSVVPTIIKLGEPLRVVGLSEATKLEIYDMSGKLIATKIFDKNHLEFAWDIRDKGIFLVKLSTKNGMESLQKIEAVE